MNVPNRHPGIDVLRPLAMLLLVGMHFFMLSGIFATEDRAGFNYAFAVVGKAFSGTALNCFWLISGYLLCASETWRWRRFWGLWGWTLFYSLVSYAIVRAVGCVDAVSWHALFPVTFNVYWFVDVYLALLLLLPAVNAGVKALPRHVFRRSLGVLLLLTSLLPACGADVFKPGPFGLAWALIVYLMGAYARRYAPFASWRLRRVLVLFCGAASLLALAIIGNFVLRHFGVPVRFDYTDYTFPATVGFSLALFVVCVRLGTRVNGAVQRFAAWISPAVFGVYVIHVSPAFRECVWPLVTGSDFRSPLFIVRFFVGVPLVFAVCLGIDMSCRHVFAAVLRHGRRKGGDA